ncbi:hypothetical protein O181_097711 [Austropuccinia psidii MF-1]|uniref:Uncharacterized protein n=1 Tax=Austropuccinia psidii MF-1 TaxID=1389203 RepID=A0A9Q3J9H1_9BASI|nr:hypothetical protein [Austropuccinia psidii MF-1]
MSSFALSVYIDKNGHKVIAVLYSGYCYTIRCIQNSDPNLNSPNISPPTTITPFSGLTLAWPQSNNPLPTTNGHPSPPALVSNLASQSAATIARHSTSDSISISATTSSNPSSELCQLFDIFDRLFRRYCCNFYNYVQNHPDNVGDYGSLSGLQASLQALVEVLNDLADNFDEEDDDEE